MNNQAVLIGIIGVLIGGIGGYAVSATVGHHNYMKDGMHMGMNTSQNMMGEGQMQGGASHMMDMTVSSEREFIEGMIPHHQEAVDTAHEVIARGGTTPEIVELVQGIVVAQETEIAAMKSWYEEWYGESYVADGSYTPMMRDLSQLSGVDLDRVFLEDMVMHHMGAIMMAQSVEPHIEHQEIRDLQAAIVATQSAEIQLMRDLLEDL